MTRVEQIQHLQYQLEVAISEASKVDPQVMRLRAALRGMGQDYFLFVSARPMSEETSEQLLLSEGTKPTLNLTAYDEALLRKLHIKVFECLPEI